MGAGGSAQEGRAGHGEARRDEGSGDRTQRAFSDPRQLDARNVGLQRRDLRRRRRERARPRHQVVGRWRRDAHRALARGARQCDGLRDVQGARGRGRASSGQTRRGARRARPVVPRRGRVERKKSTERREGRLCQRDRSPEPGAGTVAQRRPGALSHSELQPLRLHRGLVEARRGAAGDRGRGAREISAKGS